MTEDRRSLGNHRVTPGVAGANPTKPGAQNTKARQGRALEKNMYSRREKEEKEKERVKEELELLSNGRPRGRAVKAIKTRKNAEVAASAFCF